MYGYMYMLCFLVFIVFALYILFGVMCILTNFRGLQFLLDIRGLQFFVYLVWFGLFIMITFVYQICNLLNMIFVYISYLAYFSLTFYPVLFSIYIFKIFLIYWFCPLHFTQFCNCGLIFKFPLWRDGKSRGDASGAQVVAHELAHSWTNYQQE